MTDQNHDTPTAQVGQRLTAFLASNAHIDKLRITALERAGSGRSRDNWLFDLITEDPDGYEHREPLILRTDPDGGLIETDRSVEFAVLQALHGSGLPTPVARWLDHEGQLFERPSLIMGRLPGACDYRVLGNPSRPREERVGLARRFCELLAQVHSVDWQALGLGAVLADPRHDAARIELDRWAAILRTDQLESWPELEYAITVLGEYAPVSSGTVLVHSDFKPGNILLSDEPEGVRVTALLDWELAHLGDPLEDLGWVTQPLRAAEHTIEGVWDATDLVAYYEKITATTVSQTALAWWVAFSALKTAIMQVSGLRAFVEGRASEPYRPTRRVLATILDAVLKEWS